MFVSIHEVSRNKEEILYKKKKIELNHVIRDSNKEELSSFLTLSDSCILSIFDLKVSLIIKFNLYIYRTTDQPCCAFIQMHNRSYLPFKPEELLP
jgi:hypothetical protein